MVGVCDGRLTVSTYPVLHITLSFMRLKSIFAKDVCGFGAIAIYTWYMLAPTRRLLQRPLPPALDFTPAAHAPPPSPPLPRELEYIHFKDVNHPQLRACLYHHLAIHPRIAHAPDNPILPASFIPPLFFSPRRAVL